MAHLNAPKATPAQCIIVHKTAEASPVALLTEINTADPNAYIHLMSVVHHTRGIAAALQGDRAGFTKKHSLNKS